jgi:DNA-binding response OmpR family regulator
MRNAGNTVTRVAIASDVWRQTPIDVDETNIVDVYVAYLRRKLDGAHDEPMLRTVRGTGYMLQAASEGRAAGD